MNFNDLTNYLNQIDKNQIPDCCIKVYKDHKCVYEYSTCVEGYDEGEKEKDMYYLFSATKVITCTAAMRLIEEGKMYLDDPVSKYLPEYANLSVMKNGEVVPAQNILTLRHLFAMQGGFSYNLNDQSIVEVKKETNNKATTRQIAAALAKMPLAFEPGEGFRYSLCHDILAAVVEVVSGEKFSDYLHRIIFDPLGMKDTIFVPGDDVLARMKKQYIIDPVTMSAKLREAACPYRISENHESGGAGLISTVDDYIKFVDTLACGESENGYRILKPETIDVMRTDQLKEGMPRLKVGYGYALGVRTMVDVKEGNSLSPVGEFGWDGAAGSYCLIDTENKLSIFYAQHVLGCGYVYSHVHPAIRNFVYKAIENK